MPEGNANTCASSENKNKKQDQQYISVNRYFTCFFLVIYLSHRSDLKSVFLVCWLIENVPEVDVQVLLSDSEPTF